MTARVSLTVFFRISVWLTAASSTIWDYLVEEFMAVPTTDEWRSIGEIFEERWNFLLFWSIGWQV